MEFCMRSHGIAERFDFEQSQDADDRVSTVRISKVK